MKKFYEAPEMELVTFTLQDVILSSKEQDLTEYFGNGDDVIDDDLLDP